MPTTRQKQKEPVSDVDRFEKRQVAARAFSPAAPIDEERLFAGRAAQVAQVVDVINQRGQHAVIFGERGVGKTSLANIISAKLAHENNEPLIATRINCETKDTHASLWRKVFQQIDLQQRVRVIGFTQEERFKPFSVADELRRRVSADDVRRLFTVLGVDRSTLLLVILDEFDRITDKATKTAMADTIKTLSDHATPVTIILVGVGDSVDELIAEHHSIERALVQIHMPRMSSPELRDILARALSRAKLAIRPDAADTACSLSRGLPHYTHLLGLYAAREAIDRDQRIISANHIEKAIQSALGGAQQSIQNAYYQATSSARNGRLHSQVLLACAMSKTDELGYFSPADIREPLRAVSGKSYQIPGFSRYLGEFCDSNRGSVLQKSGILHRHKFRFSNPLMQPYVLMQGLANGWIGMSLLERSA